MEIVLDALLRETDDPVSCRTEPAAQAAAEAETAPCTADIAENGTPKPKNRKARRAVLCVLGVLAALCAAVLLVITHDWKEEIREYASDNPYITPYGVTMVSAHRSGSGIFPENTMMAFEGCINSKTFRTDVFEFDLHITKDGELILLHDNTLDRTTNSREAFGVKRARPENYTLEELRQLNFGEGFQTEEGDTPYRGLRGEALPDSLRAATLSQVLDYLEASGGFRYIIEIKNKKELGYRAADRLYEVLSARGLLQKTIVGTFNGEVTRYIDAHYPDMQRSASVKEVAAFYLSALMNVERAPGYYRFTALQIPANRFVVRLGTAKLVNYAHKNNIAVQYWTINDADDMRMLKQINADCVMSDVPDLAYDVLNGE